LIAKVFIRGYQHFKASRFSLLQELSVFQFFPSAGAGFRNRVMVDQIAGESSRGAVVKEDQYSEI
jgi:hypothetical protein